MVAAIEGVDVILAVDPDRSAIAEHDLVRDFRPALLDLERPLAAAEHHGHRVSPDLDRGDSERLARGQQVGSAGEVVLDRRRRAGLRAGLKPRVWQARPFNSTGAIRQDARPGDRRSGRARRRARPGAMSLSLAVAISVYIAAARSSPRSELANS